MTDLLTDEEIIEAARSHAQEETKLMPDDCERDEHIEYAESDFEKGARFARDHYEADRAKQADKIIELCAQVDSHEAREKLWRELLDKACLFSERSGAGFLTHTTTVDRIAELRIALGIDKGGA